MANIKLHCQLCGKKLSNNHLCLLCSGCNQHIPSARLHYHRQQCIRGNYSRTFHNKSRLAPLTPTRAVQVYYTATGTIADSLAPTRTVQGELFQGAAVRLGFSIPNQDQPSPSDYLRRNQDYFTDVLQIHRSTLGCLPLPRNHLQGLILPSPRSHCSYAISSEDECRRAVCGWAEEAEAKLEEWLSDEGSGLDLESINAHDITISHLLVPQAIGRHVAYPEDVRGVIISSTQQRSAESHMSGCEMPTKITYPLQGSKLAFVNYGKAFAPSHMCIYDFEAFMDKTGGGERCIAQHKACAYSYIIIDRQGETVTEEEYAHALKVWNAAGCRTLGDYLECYLRTDVGLLADVITEWRSMLAEKYDLDIVNYVSLPGYAYDAFLKMTKTNLELISDPELARKIEQSVRGGLTTCVRPLTVAKNSLVNPHHDPQKESSTYILYLDFNSLYATVMSEKLPYGNIRKLPPCEKSEFIASGLTNHDESGDIGHWVVADLRVPPEVARKTDDLPLLIHHMNIRNQDISPYNKQLLASQNRRLPRKNQKLVASHLPQKDHLILLKHLQLLIDLGVEVERESDVNFYRLLFTKILRRAGKQVLQDAFKQCLWAVFNEPSKKTRTC
ncbi:hypothetical protein C7M84_018599 [Penaeus vannamei]|uniref:DNA-directed DNA polymerase n=1 Tax=Penaeus vannamei TaxID=6689 RepID=A0A3R7NPT1_PENVA|nr:hypothetical protein C7M84_018599 [Penaeus vannamei]